MELVAGSFGCAGATGATPDGGCRAASLRSKSSMAEVFVSASSSLSTRYVSTPVAALSAAVAGPPASLAPARACMVACMAWSVDDGGADGGFGARLAMARDVFALLFANYFSVLEEYSYAVAQSSIRGPGEGTGSYM